LKKKLTILLLAFMLAFSGITAPRAQAFEPVTMVLLAPVALKVYQAAEPRLVRGAQTGGRKLVQIGGNIFEILLLPLGAVQSTVGAPFGFFGAGVKNIGRGAIAPFKMVLNVLALPFSFFGVNI
jgi:hypothetical protein